MSPHQRGKGGKEEQRRRRKLCINRMLNYVTPQPSLSFSHALSTKLPRPQASTHERSQQKRWSSGASVKIRWQLAGPVVKEVVPCKTRKQTISSCFDFYVVTPSYSSRPFLCALVCSESGECCGAGLHQSNRCSVHVLSRSTTNSLNRPTSLCFIIWLEKYLENWMVAQKPHKATELSKV